MIHWHPAWGLTKFVRITKFASLFATLPTCNVYPYLIRKKSRGCHNKDKKFPHIIDTNRYVTQCGLVLSVYKTRRVIFFEECEGKVLTAERARIVVTPSHPWYCTAHVSLNNPPPPVTAFFLWTEPSHLFLAYEQQVDTIFFVYRRLVTGNQVGS